MITDMQEANSVIELVDQLEDVVATARRLPLSASVVVNEDETLELVDRIRLGLPEELVQARHTLQDRERILTAAREEAEAMLGRAEEEATRLVREATERAAAMLDRHEITEQARAHAEAVVAEAEHAATTVRTEADAYARDVMTHLEEQLLRALTTVRRGIETLPGSEARAPRRGRRRRDG